MSINIKGLEDVETHNVRSMIFRPQIKYKGYKNLYFVGTSIHPGNGVSIVMTGAKNVADSVSEHTIDLSVR